MKHNSIERLVDKDPVLCQKLKQWCYDLNGCCQEVHKGFCLQIHLRTCQVDHDCKAIHAEYLHREPRLCKTLQ